MAIDLSIFNGALRPPPTMQDYDAAAQQFQQNKLQIAAAQQQQNDANALRQATMQFGNDPEQNVQRLREAGLFAPAQSLQGSNYKNAQTFAETQLARSRSAEQDALAGQHNLDAQIAGHNYQVQQLASIDPNDQNAVLHWYADGVDKKVSGFDTSNFSKAWGTYQQALQQGPDAVAQWKQQALLGGQSVSDTLKQQQAVKIAADNNTVSTSNNAATNAAHLQAANIAASTSRANNAATIAKDYKVAGIDPMTGNFVGAGDGTTGGMTGMVDALGQYKMDPSQVFSRMQPGVRAQVISQVQQKYPDYDPTTYAAKTKAARDFTSGALGNQMRSFQVGLDHLDQFGQLADALNNKDLQSFNKIANVVATQTGNTAPTNFETAKAVVSKEVIKSIVQGGGGVAERQEAEHLLSSSQSPAQLKGAISTLTNLMQAQHDALLQQRRAAGLPDSTIPNYSTGAAAVTHPADIQSLLSKYGGK